MGGKGRVIIRARELDKQREHVPPLIRIAREAWAKAADPLARGPIRDVDGVVEVLAIPTPARGGELVLAPRCLNPSCIPRVEARAPGGWSFVGCDCHDANNPDAARFEPLECTPVFQGGSFGCGGQCAAGGTCTPVIADEGPTRAACVCGAASP